jgi:AbiEi antitoxin C-terminal domain
VRLYTYSVWPAGSRCSRLQHWLMSRLGLVISVKDLPLAELCAARLDGELMAVDDCFAPVDVPPSMQQRALVLTRRAPERLIAERMSAAWVYGVTHRPPARHQFCVDTSNRAHVPHSSRLSVREVVIDASDLQSVAGLSVTTPLRTLIDLARSAEDFTLEHLEVLRGLLVFGSLGRAECVRALNSTAHLPHKKRAMERIGEALAQPSVTR